MVQMVCLFPSTKENNLQNHDTSGMSQYSITGHNIIYFSSFIWGLMGNFHATVVSFNKIGFNSSPLGFLPSPPLRRMAILRKAIFGTFIHCTQLEQFHVFYIFAFSMSLIFILFFVFLC